MPRQRDTTFSILKALAIILVVIAHASAPTYVSRFAYMVAVPAFFVCAGYFFNPDYLDRKITFAVRRARRLYLPFVRWSLFFLLIHNLLFPLGLLSETYGNAAGGVTHPYDWHTAMQNVWSIVFNMSGYDPFLGGAYWFFRSLLIGSLAFLLLFYGASHVKWLRTPTLQVTAVGSLALVLALWQSFEGLRITGLAQGGYRELVGVTFLSIGFLMRRHEQSAAGVIWSPSVPALLWSSLFLAVFTAWYPVAMTPSTRNPLSVIALITAGTSAFVWLRCISGYLSRTGRIVTRVLTYVGDNSIYVFGFHLLAFKAAGAIKVAAYGLPWEMVAQHPVVQVQRDDWFWLCYAAFGLSLPLLTVWAWRRFCTRFAFSWTNPRDWWRLTVAAYRNTSVFIGWLGIGIVHGTKKVTHGVIETCNDIVSQSQDDEER